LPAVKNSVINLNIKHRHAENLTVADAAFGSTQLGAKLLLLLLLLCSLSTLCGVFTIMHSLPKILLLWYIIIIIIIIRGDKQSQD